MRSAGFRFRPPVASASAAHLCPLTVMAVPLDLGLCVRVGGGGIEKLFRSCVVRETRRWISSFWLDELLAPPRLLFGIRGPARKQHLKSSQQVWLLSKAAASVFLCCSQFAIFQHRQFHFGTTWRHHQVRPFPFVVLFHFPTWCTLSSICIFSVTCVYWLNGAIGAQEKRWQLVGREVEFWFFFYNRRYWTSDMFPPFSFYRADSVSQVRLSRARCPSHSPGNDVTSSLYPNVWYNMHVNVCNLLIN